jgi:hypothetical protein
VRHTRQLVPLLLLALALAGLVTPAAAQDDPITLQAEAGFDNSYRRGQWTPIRITVANNGPDVEGLLVVDLPAGTGGDDIRYQVPVSLPGQSRKVVTLYLGLDGYSSTWTVQLLAGGKRLAETRVQPRSVDPEDALYAIASGELVDLTVLENLNQDATVAYITLDDLPADAPAWQSLDLLVLNDVDTGTLSPDQLVALRRWVEAGGHLVVTGGPNWRRTAAALGDLLPVRVTGDASVYGLGALDELAAATVATGPFVVAQGTLVDGTALISQDDLPLLARREVGIGRVDWLALDLSLAPLRDWAGTEALWARILPAGDLRPPWARPTINIWAAREGLKSLPALALPSALQMAGFLLAYTLIVGPINYFVLKRLGRRELAWVTIPGMIVLFSALAYLTGFQLRGGDLIFNRLSLVYGSAGADEAYVRSLIGVYSPRRDAYDLALSEGVFARPLVTDNTGGLSSVSAATVEETGVFALRDVQIDVAGLRAFHAEAYVPAPPIRGTLTIVAADPPRLAGSLTNDGDFVLQDATVLLGDNVVELGDLAPGQTEQVNHLILGGRAAWGGSSGTTPAGSGVVYSIPTGLPSYMGSFPMAALTGGTNYGSDLELNRRFQLLNAFGIGQGSGQWTARDATLVGWSDGVPWEVSAEGRESEVLDTTGYFIQLELEITTDAARAPTVPPVLTTWQQLSGRQYGPSGPYDFYLANDWVTFEYRPWATLQLGAVDALVVTVAASTNPGGVTVSLWDWREERWVEQPDLHNSEKTIDEPAPFVGPNDAVRVRVEVDSINGAQIDRVDVAYRGVAP